ncbi:MAG: DUF1318 domain-containing protein [Phycisphaerales bacterium]|nr:DUF1318 domain-containing protein [Phycisphaerales bacterium]
MNRLIILMLALLTLGASSPLALAQPDKDALKAQFKARETQLRELKKRGQLGETVEGYIAAVDSKTAVDTTIAKLIDDENADRRRLYQLLADEINKENPKEPVKATQETLAIRNANRNIERAGPDEFLRVAPDHWIRIKDFPDHQKITKLKTQGKVGENASGLLEIVQDADRGDSTLTSLVERENARRNADYQSLAANESTSLADIQKRIAARNQRNARIGDMIKDESGNWRKK